jgi:purine-binding chemotaxis protein CheW
VTIILRQQTAHKNTVVGIVVDAVSEVYKFTQQAIRKAPSFGNNIDSCFLKGLVSIENKLVILLDNEMLLNEDDLYSTSSKVNDTTDESEVPNVTADSLAANDLA